MYLIIKSYTYIPTYNLFSPYIVTHIIYVDSCLIICHWTNNWSDLLGRINSLALNFPLLPTVLCGGFCCQVSKFAYVIFFYLMLCKITLVRLYWWRFWYYWETQSQRKVPGPLALRIFLYSPMQWSLSLTYGKVLWLYHWDWTLHILFFV